MGCSFLVFSDNEGLLAPGPSDLPEVGATPPGPIYGSLWPTPTGNASNRSRGSRPYEASLSVTMVLQSLALLCSLLPPPHYEFFEGRLVSGSVSDSRK